MEANEELYVNYGDKGSLQTILAYGFVVPNNPYEKYDLMVNLQASYRKELYTRARELGFWQV